MQETKASLLSYSDDAESWKPAHDMAMAVYALEDLLRRGLEILASIQKDHDEWQDAVLGGEVRPDLAKDIAFWEMYGWWLRPCSKVQKEVRFFRREGFTIKLAEEFSNACHALRADRKSMSRPTEAFRGLNSEEVQYLSSVHSSV